MRFKRLICFAVFIAVIFSNSLVYVSAENNSDNDVRVSSSDDNCEDYEEIRNELVILIGQCGTFKKEYFTEDSFILFENALSDAKIIINNWYELYPESEKALEDLINAKENLKTWTKVLSESVEKGESISPEWYTEESYLPLKQSVEKGRIAVNIGNVTKETADQMIGEIEAAIELLYSIKDVYMTEISEAKKQYNLMYEKNSLEAFKTEIGRIENEFSDDISADDLRRLITEIKEAYKLLINVLGDVNGDGQITILDATDVQIYVSGLSYNILHDCSDVNFDGIISVLDATEIQLYVAGIIDEFEKVPQFPEYDKDWNLVLVNYKYPIKSGYVPEMRVVDGRSIFTFDTRAADALEKMLNDCRADGLDPLICSAYRTQELQEQLFSNQVNSYTSRGYSYEEAVELAKKSVAYPGTSEHQLGLAVDIVSLHYQILDEGQLKTAEQQWLMNNCWKYGFILRYPSEKTDITGVIFEPWHYRYVGIEAAKEITEQGITLEEYLGFV